jgi:predicted helicase
VGRGSFGYLIAQIAVETGIPPQALLELDSTMFANVLKVLNDRAEEMRNASRGKRRNGSA